MTALCPNATRTPATSFHWRVWLVAVVALLLLCLGFSAQRLGSATQAISASPVQQCTETAAPNTGNLATPPQPCQDASSGSELLTSGADDFHLEASICFSSESEPDTGPGSNSRCKQSLPLGRVHAGIHTSQVRQPTWLARSSRGPPTLA